MPDDFSPHQDLLDEAHEREGKLKVLADEVRSVRWKTDAVLDYDRTLIRGLTVALEGTQAHLEAARDALAQVAASLESETELSPVAIHEIARLALNEDNGA